MVTLVTRVKSCSLVITASKSYNCRSKPDMSLITVMVPERSSTANGTAENQEKIGLASQNHWSNRGKTALAGWQSASHLPPS